MLISRTQQTPHPDIASKYHHLDLIFQCKPNEELAFWATHSGAEVDLFWQEHGKNWAIEVKYTDAPRLTRSMSSALQDLDLAHLWVLYPGNRTYPLAPKVSALPITELPENWVYP